MSEAKDCPKCRLVNPPDAQRCDCGYDFDARAMRQSYAGPDGRAAAGWGTRLFGVLCFGFAGLFFLTGLVVTAKVPNVAAGDAGALGQVVGGFCPSLVLLIVGVLVVRRR